MCDAPSIERLGVPKYNWWNECLHGVGRAGIATIFPKPSAWPRPTHWALALVQLQAHCERRILPLGHGAQTFFLGQS